jgi:hypothetical protein
MEGDEMRKIAYVLCGIVLTVLLFVNNDCLAGNKVNTAAELASALKNNGVNYEVSQETPAKPMKCPKNNIEINIAEVVNCSGNEVNLEIVRVNDQKSFDDLKSNLGIFLAFTELQYKSTSDSIVTNATYPFFVTVIKEPNSGSVKTAMEQIFPGQNIEVMTASAEGRSFVGDLMAELGIKSK